MLIKISIIEKYLTLINNRIMSMHWKKILIVGVLAGIVFGIALFICGAITARIVYGTQMAPESKFDESQMNAFYFFGQK